MRKRVVVAGVGVVLLVAVGSYFVFARSSLDQTIRGAAASANISGYSLKLPDGYSFDANSIEAKDGIIIAKLSAPNGAKVIITQQRRPETLNLTRAEGKKFRTLYGEALVQDFDDQTLGTLLTDQTVVFVNAKPPIGQAQMETIVNSLQPVK